MTTCNTCIATPSGEPHSIDSSHVRLLLSTSNVPALRAGTLLDLSHTHFCYKLRLGWAWRPTNLQTWHYIAYRAYCAEVPLRNCSLSHSRPPSTVCSYNDVAMRRVSTLNLRRCCKQRPLPSRCVLQAFPAVAARQLATGQACRGGHARSPATARARRQQLSCTTPSLACLARLRYTKNLVFR